MKDERTIVVHEIHLYRSLMEQWFMILLGFLEREVRKDNLPMVTYGDNPEAPQPREMIDLEATFEKLENELNEVRIVIDGYNTHVRDISCCVPSEQDFPLIRSCLDIWKFP